MVAVAEGIPDGQKTPDRHSRQRHRHVETLLPEAFDTIKPEDKE